MPLDGMPPSLNSFISQKQMLFVIGRPENTSNIESIIMEGDILAKVRSTHGAGRLGLTCASLVLG